MRSIAAMLVVVCVARGAFACAPAPHAGEHIDVVEESAVIVWDPTTKTEQFIRRATFRGAARDFGFLVPTPGVPALAEFDDRIFQTLEEKTTRKTIHTTRKTIDWTPVVVRLFRQGDGNKGGGITARAPVEVLSTERIAGYEASVLDATDATALLAWLGEHGYAASPDLTEWLDAYIQKGWKITAFKVEKPGGTAPVRMTFLTDRPFFPYREPASQRENASIARSLRIFFLGPERVEGKIGEGDPWPSYMMWSETIDTNIGGIPLPHGTRLTRFEDTSMPRPGTDDLFFARSADQSEVVPEPWVAQHVEKTNVPLDLVFAPVLVIGFFFIRRRRRQPPKT
jgi:hypothetical protein